MAENAPDAIRWQGFTHKELYKLLHEGSGPAASADPSRRWAELAGTLTEVGQDLKHALDLSRASWSGTAAGSAYERLTSLVDWAQQTAADATAMRQSVENQADYLARARADMPVPEDMQPAPTGDAAQVLAAQRDKEPVDASSSTGAQRAFEVMTAYQRNTTTNTAAMADFHAPAELLGDLDLIRRGHGGGITITTPVISVEVPVPLPPPAEHHDHGYHHHQWDGTIGAGFEGELPHRPVVAPGSFTAAGGPGHQPFLGPTIGWTSFGDEYSSGSGRSSGGGSGGAPAPRAGGTSVGAPVPSTGTPGSPAGGAPSGSHLGTAAGAGPHSADFQSAAAGQAAAAAGTPAAATPGAAAGTGSAGTTSGTTDPRALRRFGVDSTIGSGQWFGDSPDYEVRGAAPTSRRRFDPTKPDPVTESVSVDGEEHQLPHTVIGE